MRNRSRRATVWHTVTHLEWLWISRQVSSRTRFKVAHQDFKVTWENQWTSISASSLMSAILLALSPLEGVISGFAKGMERVFHKLILIKIRNLLSRLLRQSSELLFSYPAKGSRKIFCLINIKHELAVMSEGRFRMSLPLTLITGAEKPLTSREEVFHLWPLMQHKTTWRTDPSFSPRLASDSFKQRNKSSSLSCLMWTEVRSIIFSSRVFTMKGRLIRLDDNKRLQCCRRRRDRTIRTSDLTQKHRS